MHIAFTGHRPQKISNYDEQRLVRLATAVLSKVITDKCKSPNQILAYSGMSLGWDQACTQACIDLGIPFVAAVPFKHQTTTWNRTQRDQYQYFLEQAKEVVYVDHLNRYQCKEKRLGEYREISIPKDVYHIFKLNARNRYLVDQLTPGISDCLISLYSGQPSGTAQCVRYAKESGLNSSQILNVWKSWLKYSKQEVQTHVY
ncbi:hypothetical protein K9N68_37360 (plasmid) [Kovacikia minuta CCNUW1]|uniref:hypothetical protein n=1 Tax=Kovacikia minuta TaxID=2931930 RepID=UPI001CCD13A0|nr:hypothetical protein [Kovacikia minuta]UBF29882.1 hypothetical protein K9N68_37360 [Kovacikia minuta CCNUW1]